MGLSESIPVAASLTPIDEMAHLPLIKKQETTVNLDNWVHIKASTYNGIYPSCNVTLAPIDGLASLLLINFNPELGVHQGRGTLHKVRIDSHRFLITEC